MNTDIEFLSEFVAVSLYVSATAQKDEGESTHLNQMWVCTCVHTHACVCECVSVHVCVCVVFLIIPIIPLPVRVPRMTSPLGVTTNY